MTIQEAYKRFMLKINKNDTNSTLSVPIPVFIMSFNEQALSWLSDKLTKTPSTDSIHEVEYLLETDNSVFPEAVNDEFAIFNLPSDFFRYESSIANGKRDDCSRKLYVFTFKPKNKNIVIPDEFLKPSFEWEEVPGIISKGKIKVYKDNTFSITSLNLDYYRKPVEVDIEGYTTVNGQLSQTVHPDLEDQHVNEIINRCVIETLSSLGDVNGFQLAGQRLQNES